MTDHLNIDQFFADFKKELSQLLLKYCLDKSVGISAPDLAEHTINYFSTLQQLARKLK